MSEPLDFTRLETVCWRALCRYDLTELEMLMAATIIRLSFVIGEPCLRLEYAVELAHLTGMTKGKANEVVKRLKRGRALEVSPDRCVYTFLPPSKAWPWMFGDRVEHPTRIDEMENGIIWANKGGPAQGELFAPDADREFAEALAIERMREGLIEYHQAAATRFAGGQIFSVTDRSPKPAPAPHELSSGEGPTRPLKTTVGSDRTSAVESLSERPEEASEMHAPRSIAAYQDGSRKGNPVPEKGTHLLRAFKDSEESKALNALKAFKGEFPNREPLEPLDPGATEAQIMDWLKVGLGEKTMEKYGGWWRLRIRESRWAAINVCMELRLRFTDPHLKPLRNPGGWARDKYFEIRGEESEFQQQQN